MHSPQTSTCLRVAAQNTDVDMGFCGNRPLLIQGQGPRCGPQCQHRTGHHHGLRSYHPLLTSGCSSLDSSESPVLSLFIVHILLFHFLFHFSKFTSSSQWSPGSLSLCHRLRSGLRSGTLIHALWHWAGFISRVLSSLPPDLLCARLVLLSS